MLYLWLSRDQLFLSRCSKEIWRFWLDLKAQDQGLLCIISPTQAMRLVIWRRVLLGQTAEIITGQGDSQRTLFFIRCYVLIFPHKESRIYSESNWKPVLPAKGQSPKHPHLFSDSFFHEILFAYLECLSYSKTKINNS